MKNPLIAKLQEQRAATIESIESMLSLAETEDRSLTEDENSLLEEARSTIDGIDRKLTPLVEFEESRTSADVLDARVGRLQHTAKVSQELAPVQSSEVRSLGESFVRSEQFRMWDGASGSGRFTADTTLGEVRAPALLTTTTAPGNVFIPEPQKIMAPQGMYSYRLWDAVGHIQVRSGSVDYVVYGSKQGAKTPAKVAEGAAKPEVELTASSQSITLDTWAGWVQITRQLLQDGSPAIRRFIDGELTRGLLTQLEKDIATKIGAATLTTATGAAGKPMVEVLRQASAIVEAAGFRPNAALVNPADAATIDIGAAGLGGAMGYGSNVSPWGLRIIPDPNIKAGEAYVGDFETGVQVLERTGVEIFITDSHDQNFVKNIFVILGEIRAASVVAQPAALAKAVTA